MEKSLREFKDGEIGVVRRLDAVGRIRRKLIDMGITAGVEIKLIKAAPLGDPIEIQLWDYRLAIRKALAQSVILETGGAL